VFKPGGDLRTLVDTLLRVCDTVAFAHTHGVIHRDIKPANVMVGSFGEVYLMDWGIALLPGDAPGGVEGTPSWLAPEQARGDNVDVRVDVYGVGGLLYHALCGAKPHPGGSADERLARAVRDPVIPPQAITPGLPPELCRIAMRALAFDPAERYPDVASLRADLDAALRAGWWLETCSWPAGAEIVREGDAADSAWIILEGRATVWRGGWEVTEIGPGATIGEMALLCGENRTATVTALTDVVARVIRADMLESALQDAWLGPIVRGLAARLLQRDRE
jgi:serine/threonine-protein kinase